MPEIVEVFLMKEAMESIMNNKEIGKITVMGGRYHIYKIQDDNGQWISKIGKKRITLKTHPEAKLFIELDNLDILNSLCPLKVKSHKVHGKFCWIELDQGWYIAFTFGMTGGIYYEPTDKILANHAKWTEKSITKSEYTKHFHIKFEASDGSCFYFGDPRQFGTVTISNDKNALNKKLKQLGPDMFSHTPITNQQFIAAMRGYNHQNICKVLMDQKAISGVGNYIKAECLYAACINPWALVSDITDDTLIILYDAIRQITKLAYGKRGASLYTYTGSSGEKGGFQEVLKVYGKTKDPNGLQISHIDEKVSPDKRATHYVLQTQIIGNHRDPKYMNISNTPKIKVTMKNISPLFDKNEIVQKLTIKLKNKENIPKLQLKIKKIDAHTDESLLPLEKDDPK